jgi:NAD(P)-dependent dehydrogenase (short-subunit alcohol dehydrogenase family)
MAAYNASKAALASFIMTMQLELGDSSIHVVDLQPGDIRTEFNQGVIVSDNVNSDDGKIARTWEVIERNMKNAPGPDLVAREVLRLIQSVEPPPRLAIGNVFESKIAPLIFRFLPQRVRIWGLKKYYGI